MQRQEEAQLLMQAKASEATADSEAMRGERQAMSGCRMCLPPEAVAAVAASVAVAVRACVLSLRLFSFFMTFNDHDVCTSVKGAHRVPVGISDCTLVRSPLSCCCCCCCRRRRTNGNSSSRRGSQSHCVSACEWIKGGRVISRSLLFSHDSRRLCKADLIL